VPCAEAEIGNKTIPNKIIIEAEIDCLKKAPSIAIKAAKDILAILYSTILFWAKRKPYFHREICILKIKV